MVQWLRSWHWNQTDVDSIPTYLLISFMTLGKLPDIYELYHLPHLWNGDNNITLLEGLLRELHELLCVCVCVLSHFSHGQLFATLWTVACQALLSMGFSRQEHWSWLQCPPPGDLPYLGIKCASHMSPALTGRVFTSNASHQF